MGRGSPLATQGPRRTLTLVAFVLLAASLAPSSFGDTATQAAFELPPGPHLAGEPMTLRVRLGDASGTPVPARSIELSPYGLVGVTNDAGVAIFRVTEPEPVAREVVALVDGAPLGSTRVTWQRPSALVDAPNAAYVRAVASIAVVARWLPDGSPIAGADVGLLRGDAIIDSARTGQDGNATFHVTEATPGNVTYEVAFDDPALRTASVPFTVAWSIKPVNLPPIVENVSIDFAGRMARAVIGRVSDPEGDSVRLSYRWEVDGVDRGFDEPVIEVPRGARVSVGVFADDGARAPGTLEGNWSAVAQAPLNAGPALSVLRLGDLRVGEHLVFDARSSSDAEGRIVEASWHFSDGAAVAGLFAQHAFATAGEHWAELHATDDEGATSVARVAFDVIGPDAPAPPPPAAPRFTLQLDGVTYTLDEYGAADVAILRRLELDGIAGALLSTPDGVRLWTPSQDRLAGVATAAPVDIVTSYVPGEMRTTFELSAAGLRLARLTDPQPGLAFLDAEGDGAFVHWRDGTQLAVLTDGSRATLRHQIERLTLRLEVEPRSEGAYAVRALAASGAPIEQVSIAANGIVIAGGRDTAIEVVLTPTTDTRITATATDLAGDDATAQERITPPPPPPPVDIPTTPTPVAPVTPTRPTTDEPPPVNLPTPETPRAPSESTNGTVTAAARDEAPGLGLGSMLAAAAIIAAMRRRR